MRRNNINPVLKVYETTTTAKFDLTQNKQVKVYSASGFNKIEEGVFLFEYTYEPILNPIEFNKIKAEFDNPIVLSTLYNTLSGVYYMLYQDCVKWYKENSASRVFNFEEQLTSYDKLQVNDYSCPILKHIKKESQLNINFIIHFKNLCRKSELKNITSINELLYGRSEFSVTDKPTPTKEGWLILNSVANIVYGRFRAFLEKENPNKSPTKVGKSADTLKTNLSQNEALKLHKILIERQYINQISNDNFLTILSGTPIGKKRIVWKKSKAMAFQLFSTISSNFSITHLNNSVQARLSKKFDSNDKPKINYMEIELILKEDIK